MTSTMTSTINGDMEFGSDGFPTDEEYNRREIKLGGPVIYCGGGRWMLAEEVANCNDCETPLDHLRDGTTEEGQRCNNCYWEGQGGRDAAEAIITPDYRINSIEEEFCWEIDCDVCGEKQGKDDCPFETGYADDEYICDECFMACGKCSGSKNPVFGARARATGWVCECEEKKPKNKKKRKKLVIIY